MRLKEDIHAQNVKLRIENHDLKTRLLNAKKENLWLRFLFYVCCALLGIALCIILHNFA